MSAQPAPTRLMLFSCAEWAGHYKTGVIFARIMHTIKVIRERCEYTFPLPMPIALEEMKTVLTEQKTTFWGKTPYEEKTPWLNYYLVFDRALTEEEMNLWRMFKMGRYAYRGFSDE